MEIMKVFSSYDDYGYEEDRIYSVLMDEEELMLFSEYTPGVTAYDRTDRIKQMKDSDVLAEKKRSNAGTYVKSAKTGIIGSTLGAGTGAVLGMTKFGKALGVKKAAMLGGAIGGALGVGGGLASTHKERSQNRFVNRRLKEAQRQALRREGRDWKNNAVNREGYTY